MTPEQLTYLIGRVERLEAQVADLQRDLSQGRRYGFRECASEPGTMIRWTHWAEVEGLIPHYPEVEMAQSKAREEVAEALHEWQKKIQGDLDAEKEGEPKWPTPTNTTTTPPTTADSTPRTGSGSAKQTEPNTAPSSARSTIRSVRRSGRSRFSRGYTP